MSDPTKKVFSSAVAGYSKTEVDQYVAWVQKSLTDLENYNALAVREQNNLRERISQLESDLKAARERGFFAMAGATGLGSIGMIRASGPDAVAYLQSQTTNDVEALDKLIRFYDRQGKSVETEFLRRRRAAAHIVR